MGPTLALVIEHLHPFVITRGYAFVLAGERADTRGGRGAAGSAGNCVLIVKGAG